MGGITGHAPISLTLLGGFAARAAAEPVTVPPGGARVLATLALSPVPLPRSVVAGRLWPDAGERSAGANLRTAVWRLRDVRGPLLADTGPHDLALHGDVRVDVRDAVTEAQALVRPGPVDDLPYDIHLAGDLLPGWYDDWVLVERERLHQLRLHALEALADRLLDEDRCREAVDVAYRAVALEPLRDSARCVLVRALLSEGNAREALEAYRSFERLLRTELGVRPSARLTRLVEFAGEGAVTER